MCWNRAEPEDAGVLEGDGGVEAAGDGLVDDGLLLLFEQRDELALGGDGSVDAVVGMGEVLDDRRLLGDRRNERFKAVKVIGVEAEPTVHHSRREGLDSIPVLGRAEEAVVVPRVRGRAERVHAVGRTHDPLVAGDPETPIPSQHDVHHKVVEFDPLVSDKRGGSSVRLASDV